MTQQVEGLSGSVRSLSCTRKPPLKTGENDIEKIRQKYSYLQCLQSGYVSGKADTRNRTGMEGSGEMRSAGQTYTDLLAEMIEDRKKRRLEEDVRKWSSRKKKDYVSLSEIKD